MDHESLNHLVSYLLGLTSMAYFHNVFVSTVLYKSGHPNVKTSNMLKIIFNLSGVSHSIITYVTIMIITQCQLLSYLTNLSNFFYRTSLAAFLLWRLKQIEYSTWDRWISFGLFLTRTVLNISVIAIFHPVVTTTDGIDCHNLTQQRSMSYQLGYISLDFIIDTFVTIRLVQILNDGNRNSAEVASIIGRNNSPTRRTTLFTAVLYWNFLRLTIDFLYNGITVLTLIEQIEHNKVDKIIIESLLCFVSISQSYLITIDAEIVKVIEGRNLNDFNNIQNDTEWLSRNGNGGSILPTMVTSIPSSRTRAATRSVTSIYHKILQKTTSSNNISSRSRNNNTQSWFTSPSSSPVSPTSPQLLSPNLANSSRQVKRPTDNLRHTASFQLDKGKFVVVSMQRLTFFEWADMVTGHGNCGNCSKCSMSNSSPNTPILEEIPDIPPLPTHLQDQRQFNQPHRQFTQPQRQSQRQLINHQRQISQDDAEALLPSLAYIPQSRRGSDSSTMTNSTSQTKTNDSPFDFKQSFI